MEEAGVKAAPTSKKKPKGARTRNGIVNGVGEKCSPKSKAEFDEPETHNSKADANENCLVDDHILDDGCEGKLSRTNKELKKRKSKAKTKGSENVDRLASITNTVSPNLGLELPSTSTPNRLDELEIEHVLPDCVAKLDLNCEDDRAIELAVIGGDIDAPEGTKESEQVFAAELIQPKVEYVQYESELQMPMIMKIIQKDLSEPYSIYTYRYFIHNWPQLCFLAMCEGHCVGAIVCKLDIHRKSTKRGYIAMLAVDKLHRKRSIGSTLVSRAIKQMIDGDAHEVVLETEVTNVPALRLYEQLGFVRDKRLFRYYLNGVDALRLKLWLR